MIKTGFEFVRLPYDGKGAKITVSLENQDANIHDVADAIESFLLACGFHSDTIAKLFGENR